MTNAMNVIYPYRHESRWVFDDTSVGLTREPFVFGIDDMLSLVAEKLGASEKGPEVLFSSRPFPNWQARLTHLRAEYEGHWYKWTETGMEGWLCPALFKYFDEAPPEIWLAIGPRK